jgi:hypothetical protein
LGQHGLGQASDLDLKVEHVESADSLASDLVVAEVTVVPSYLLVTPRTERVRAGPRQDDRTHTYVVASRFEGARKFKERLWSKGVATFGPVDRDARNSFGDLIDNVLVVTATFERRRWPGPELLDRVKR